MGGLVDVIARLKFVRGAIAAQKVGGVDTGVHESFLRPSGNTL
jgi:hypothetical protein